MTKSDYPAFRKFVDEVDQHPMNPILIERAGLPNAYVVHQDLLEKLMEKARAYDEMTGGDESPEDPDVSALKSMMEGKTA